MTVMEPITIVNGESVKNSSKKFQWEVDSSDTLYRGQLKI